MMILISGGNGSGKSVYAEKLAATMDLPRYYIATMVSQNEENEARIEKHRRQRAGLGFYTIELPCYVSRAKVPANAAVLLEDVSNLLANMVFMEHGSKEDVLVEVLRLRDQCSRLIVVTISGMSEEAYDGETAEYIRAMHWLNQQLFLAADAAVEMVDGQPVNRKGNWNEII